MKPKLLLVTDLNYPAQGRRYGDEDTYLAARLREDFTLAMTHPLDALAMMDDFDLVLVRNSGPVIHYQDTYDAFTEHARTTGKKVFTQLSGRADMAGKQYLVDLSAAGHPVIPTIDDPADLKHLPETTEYVLKPKLGADSIGLQFVTREELSSLQPGTTLIQPHIRFQHEISFYFIGHDYQYALYAPDPQHRWNLERYAATPEDQAFAQTFITWNTIQHGIQRVDACRTAEGDLLLVELEDLNPYLSLDLLDDATRETFVHNLKQALHTQHAE